MIKTLTNEILEYCYRESKTITNNRSASRFWFLAEGICGVFGCDPDMSDSFGRSIADVMIAIRDGKAREYASGEKYAIVCNLLNKLGWLEFGESIWEPHFGVGAFPDFALLIRPDSPFYDPDGAEFNPDNARVLLDWLEETKK